MTIKQIISSIFGVFRVTRASEFQIPSSNIDNSDWEAKEIDDDEEDNEEQDEWNNDDEWGNDDDDD